jgi:hypothetical protein
LCPKQFTEKFTATGAARGIVFGYFASQSKSFLVSATAQNYYEASQISPQWSLQGINGLSNLSPFFYKGCELYGNEWGAKNGNF